MCGGGAGLREAVLARLRALRAPHVEELANYCVRLEAALEPHMVVLHGSVARGLHGRWSDIDLLVVADFEEPFLDRLSRLLELAQPGLPVEPLGYTPEEFRAMLERLNPLALDALEFGIPLLGEECFAAYKRRFEEIKRSEGLRRHRLGWSRGRGGG